MRAVLIIAIVIAVILLAFFVFAFIIMTKPGRRRDTSYFRHKMYAHRGLHGDGVPENSLTAFRLARENGYGVELDVQMSKDGILVVFHDGNLRRMCGVDKKLKECTYEELSTYRLSGTDEKIPLLDEALATLKDVDLICEIKADNGTRNYELCEKTYDKLKTYGGKFCIESFSPFLVAWFRKNHPEIIRGQLSENFVKTYGFTLIHLFMSELWLNIISKPDFVAFNHKHKSIGWRVTRLLYRPMWIAWTARGDKEIESAEKHYDAVIFEKKPEADAKGERTRNGA